MDAPARHPKTNSSAALMLPCNQECWQFAEKFSVTKKEMLLVSRRVDDPMKVAARGRGLSAAETYMAVAICRQGGKSGDVRVFEQGRPPTTERCAIGKTNGISPLRTAGICHTSNHATTGPEALGRSLLIGAGTQGVDRVDLTIIHPQLGLVTASAQLFDTAGLPDLILGTDVMRDWADRWFFRFDEEGGAVVAISKNDPNS